MLAHGRESVSTPCHSLTFVNAAEMVRRPCLVSTQCLREAAVFSCGDAKKGGILE